MSSHRSTSRRPTSTSPATDGLRRATTRRRRITLSTASAIGGVALLVTGIGAAAANHLIPTGQHPSRVVTNPAPTGYSPYLAERSPSAGGGQGTDSVSRSGARPGLTPSRTSAGITRSDGTLAASNGTRSADLVAAATRAAALRAVSLQAADADAESYAKQLKTNAWVLPTSGFHITEWFGVPGPYWATGYHTGIDFATAYGTPVVAVQDATVFQTGWDGAYGNQIRLQLGNGDQVWYNHLSAIGVTKGQQVRRGQLLGRVGETGNAFGYHLHFEYRLAKDLTLAVDPKPFFAAHGIVLH